MVSPSCCCRPRAQNSPSESLPAAPPPAATSAQTCLLMSQGGEPVCCRASAGRPSRSLQTAVCNARVNYRSPREGLFSILKELTNQCIIIANELPLNYSRVSSTTLVRRTPAVQGPGCIRYPPCPAPPPPGSGGVGDSGAALVGTAPLLELSTERSCLCLWTLLPAIQEKSKAVSTAFLCSIELSPARFNLVQGQQLLCARHWRQLSPASGRWHPAVTDGETEAWR